MIPMIAVQGRCAVLVSPLELDDEADRVLARSGFGQPHAFHAGPPGTREPEAEGAGGTAMAQHMQEDGAADAPQGWRLSAPGLE